MSTRCDARGGERGWKAGAAACALLITLGMAAYDTSRADDTDAAFTSTEDFASLNGAQVYSHICQGCHMAHGEGAVGAGHYPKLAGDATLASWRYVALTVLAGRNGMPPFGLPASPYASHLSDAQVAAVVNYVRSHFGNRFKETITATEVAHLPHPKGMSAY
ncbi:MAG TPA: cytochrome c [Steroidobacteraceae bacterium]|nr:cytochrome c [Steroidobacteraceae bacterium]